MDFNFETSNESSSTHQNASRFSQLINGQDPAPPINEKKYKSNEPTNPRDVGGRLRPNSMEKQKILEAAKLNKLTLSDFKCLETTYSNPNSKIMNSFHKDTLEKIMFKLSFNEKINFEDECYMTSNIGKIPNSKHFFSQMRSYQQIQMSSGRTSRWGLSMEAGVCSLKDALEYRRKCPYTEQNVIYIGYHILKALDVLHQNMIFHSDIKPANIFLFKSDNNEWNYKIGDFGTSFYCTEPVIRIEDVLGYTSGYSHPNIPEYFEKTIKIKETVNFFEADLFSMAKTFKDLIQNTILTKCKEFEEIINDMTQTPLVDILNRMQKLYEQHAKIPDESIVEKKSRKNLLKNYNVLLNYEKNLEIQLKNDNVLERKEKKMSNIFETKSLFDTMEYCRILEYFLLLRDFKSLKLWKKKTIKLFGDLIHKIFRNDEIRGNKVLAINLDILEASFCDEEAYIIGKTNPKEVENLAKRKEQLLKKVCEESESIFGTKSLASSYTKINLCSFYEEMKKHYQLDVNQEEKFNSLRQFQVANSIFYSSERLEILNICKNFFGFETTEPWVVEFTIKMFQKDSDLENWIGAPPLDYYFKLQDCFADKKIEKTLEEHTEFLRSLFDGKLLFSTIAIFLKSNNNIPFPWFYMDPSAHYEYKIKQIKKVSNQFYEEGRIDEMKLKSLFDYLEKNSNKNGPLENIYLADFYYYELLPGIKNYKAAIPLYEKAISAMMSKLNHKSFFVYNSLCILGRAYSVGEEFENITISQQYFEEAEKFILFVQNGLR